MDLGLDYLIQIDRINIILKQIKMNEDDPPFFQGLSGIQETQAIASSRMTSASYAFGEQAAELFHDRRQFVCGILQSWGIQMCDLSYSSENIKILNCLMGLVEMRQKDIANRNRAKQELSAVTFDRDKYRSCLQLAKRQIQEKHKILGRVENESMDIKNKMKKLESASRKEQDESKKSFAMLKSKNQQILHQMKKKEQEVLRIKEQMKKSVGEKLEKGVLKNSFQIIEGVVGDKANLSPTKRDQQKYNFLLARNQNQLKLLRQQNLLMKQKLHQIRDLIVDLSVWIDQHVFHEETTEQALLQKYRNKMPINHYLLFKKQSITQELKQIIEGLKDGINQIRQGRQIKMKKKVQERYSVKLQQTGFKKKLSVRQELDNSYKLPRKVANQVQNLSKNYSNTPNLNRYPSLQSSSTKARQTLPPQFPNVMTSSATFGSFQPVEIADDILLDDGDNDSSIISHISMEEIKKEKAYDKWDVLFRD